MISVHIWQFSGSKEAWGHASLECFDNYISWWPAQTGRIHSKIHSNIFTALPIANRSFSDDVDGEGRFPDYTTRIDGLNERGIISWWQHFALSYGGFKDQGPPSAPWSSLDWNCSKVVATALKEGGGDEYASFYYSNCFIWTPEKVKDYAESIVKGLIKKK